MKDLQNLTGAKILSKEEQQVVKGGVHKDCYHNPDICGPEEYCDGHVCMPL